MDENEINDQLKKFEKEHEYNWQYQIFKFRRHLDIWASKHVKNPAGQIKQSYLPVIFNTSVDGSTAGKIISRTLVVKQNLSRTIKELESSGMIFTNTSTMDKRTEQLNLTPAGKDLVLDAHIELAKLTETYKELVGEHDLQIAVNVLTKIIDYHDRLIEQGDQCI